MGNKLTQIPLPNIFEHYSKSMVKTKLLDDGSLELYVFPGDPDYDIKIAMIKCFQDEDDRYYEVYDFISNGEYYYQEMESWTEKSFNERTIEDDLKIVIEDFCYELDEYISYLKYYRIAIKDSIKEI